MTKDSKYKNILSVATVLISEKGYDGTSLQAIANKVGLHKSSLFHYIKHKEELLLRILEESVDQVTLNLEHIINQVDLEPEEKLKKAINNHLIMLEEYFKNSNVYLNEFKSLSRKNQLNYLEKRKKYEKTFEKIILEMQRNGYFPMLNPKIVTYGLLGMLNWVIKWFKKDGPLKMNEISDIFYRMIMGKNSQDQIIFGTIPEYSSERGRDE